MPTWLKIVLGVAAGGAVVIGGLIAFLLHATSGLILPIDRQLTALKSGDFPAAYAETSQAFQQATSLAAFTIFVNAHPIMKDAADHSFPNRSYENDVGHVTGTLTSSTGGVLPVEYDLVKENEAWKILNIDTTAK